MLEHGVLSNTKPCQFGSTFKIYVDKTKRSNRIYKCVKTGKKLNFLKNSVFANPRVSIKDFLLVLYYFVLDCDITFVELHVDICKKTICAIKDIILNRLEKKVYDKIGGTNKTVCIDETAICKGLISNNNLGEEENSKDVQWIVGGVIEDSKNEFFISEPIGKGTLQKP